MPRISSRTLVAGLVIALLGIALGFALTRSSIAVRTATAVPAMPVRVFGLGTVEARVLSRIGFEVGAAIVELNADHGDVVRQGQVLARLNSTQQRAKVARAEASLRSAEVAVQKAQANLAKARAILAQRLEVNKRKQELVSRQVSSAQAGEEAQRDEDVAIADVRVSESDIGVANAQLSDARSLLAFETAILQQHTLAAPFDALVVDRQKELGTVIKAGDAIFTLVAKDSIWVLAYVDESRAGAIRLGQPVEVRLRSLPGQSFRGSVARIGIESDRVSEERRVYVSCSDCPQQFHLGEQAEVLIAVGELANAILVPEAMVSSFEAGKGTIWTLENGVLRRRQVSLGLRTEDARIEVRSGLPHGALVVTHAEAALEEGKKARVARGERP